jgi:hypothetical protein
MNREERREFYLQILKSENPLVGQRDELMAIVGLEMNEINENLDKLFSTLSINLENIGANIWAARQ